MFSHPSRRRKVTCWNENICVPSCCEATVPAALIDTSLCWWCLLRGGGKARSKVNCFSPCCKTLLLTAEFAAVALYVKLQWISIGVVHAKSVLKRVSVSVLIQRKLFVNCLVKVINGNNYSAFKWSAMITLCINLDGWIPGLQEANEGENRLLPPISLWQWSALTWEGDPGPNSSTHMVWVTRSGVKWRLGITGEQRVVEVSAEENSAWWQGKLIPRQGMQAKQWKNKDYAFSFWNPDKSIFFSFSIVDFSVITCFYFILFKKVTCREITLEELAENWSVEQKVEYRKLTFISVLSKIQKLIVKEVNIITFP